MNHLQLTSRAPWETEIQAEVDLEYLGNHYNGLALSATQQLQSIHQQPNMNMAAKDTKPRLGKDEVDALECEFLTNRKPSTQTKRQFAQDMGVDLARVNNWFQNRRAKEKQEKKQIKYEEQQAQEELDSEQDLEQSPAYFYDANQYYINNDTLPTYPKQDYAASIHGSVYCPQFSDSSAPRIESLLQTLATAETLYSKTDQGGMASSQSCRDSQLVESEDIPEVGDNASSTLGMRNLSESLDDIATLAGQSKVSLDGGSLAIPLSHFPVGTHDKNMFTATGRTPDETIASDSSTDDPDESWELLPRCVYGGKEAQPQVKSQVLDPIRQALVERIMVQFIPGEPPEGVTPKQVSELRSRAKPYSKLSELERWNEIFRLLFPGANIPSPYWEPVQEQVSASPSSQVLMHYDDYIHRELPRLVRARVEEIVRREMQPIEETIFANLELLVRECQTQLSSSYREEQPIELNISSGAPLAMPLDMNESTKAAEEIDNLGYPSAEFFESVIQTLPVLEEEYVVDFSTSDLGHSDKIAPFNFQLDSEYVSISRCICKEECMCFTSTMYLDDSNVDAILPIFDRIHGDLEPNANSD
ncbi:hypothetical protein IFR05_013875 [Cadophora sp. M221]|nr:hypothetical protein IFR05_013875 [Cadophora sp. M221]